jgi:hypothetical protein
MKKRQSPRSKPIATLPNGLPADMVQPPLPRPEDFDDPAGFRIEALKVHHQQEVMTFITLARNLFEARKELLDEDFDGLWRVVMSGQPKMNREKVLFVGQRLFNLNTGIYRSLPKHWAILHCLAQLGSGKLEALTKSGKVHPKMKRAEAERLVGEERGGQAHAE